MTTYLLILYLAGVYPKFEVVHSYSECITRSQFALRFDPHMRALCVPSTGEEA